MGRDRIEVVDARWRSCAAWALFVALACITPCTHAADGDTPATSWRYRDYLLYSGAQPAPIFDSGLLAGPQISIAELLRQNDRSFGAMHNLILSAGFDNRADWESIRYGVGLFACLPESGQFHFNLYVRPNAQRPGLRWQLQPTGLPTVNDSGHRLWSIGGFLDYGRGRAGLHSSIGFAPQLIVNLGTLLQWPGDAQASLQYAYWRSDLGDDRTSRRALQAALIWHF